MMSAPLTAPAEAHAPDEDGDGPDAPGSDALGPDAPDLTPAWLAHILAVIILFMLRHKLSRRRPGRRSAWWHDLRPRPPSPRPPGPPGSTQARGAPARDPFGDAVDRMLRARGMGPGPAQGPGRSQSNGSSGGCVRNAPTGAPPGPPPAPPGPPSWWEHPAIMEFMLAVVDATLPPGVPPAQQGLAAAPPPNTAPALDAAPPWIVLALTPALWRRVIARAAIGPIRAGAGPPIRAGTGPPTGARAGPSAGRDGQICNA